MNGQTLDHLTVLIVDDKQDNLEVVKKFLEFNGAQVHSAENGQQGLTVLESLRPDVILMDLYMPKMDGWAAMRSIRQVPAVAATPIVAITALDAYHARAEILRDGFDGYIRKPFVLETLIADILRVLEASDRAGV